MIDIKEAARTIEAFRKLVNDIEQEIKLCGDEINECDKAFGDIRHCCEINYPLTPSQKTTICKVMREFSKRRRAAKDRQYVLEPLLEHMAHDKYFKNDIGKMANEIKRRLEFVTSERKYVPRVLDNLFDKEVNKVGSKG